MFGMSFIHIPVLFFYFLVVFRISSPCRTMKNSLRFVDKSKYFHCIIFFLILACRVVALIIRSKKCAAQQQDFFPQCY